MYNENENNYNTLNNNNNEADINAHINGSAPQVNGAEAQNTTYSYTREQLENQWQPNTGSYFTDSSTDKKTAKKAKKNRRQLKRQQKKQIKSQ